MSPFDDSSGKKQLVPNEEADVRTRTTENPRQEPGAEGEQRFQQHSEPEPEKKGKAGWLGGLGILGIILLKGKFYMLQR